jgi:hypothetical protein
MTGKRCDSNPKNTLPWDEMVAAIQAYMRACLGRGKAQPDGMQPMIAALGGVTDAVECAIDGLVEKGELRGVRYSKTWLLGVAHEWLKPLRKWQENHFWPEVSKDIDREVGAFMSLAREAEEEARDDSER